jgi:outer membrane protein insertion porin family
MFLLQRIGLIMLLAWSTSSIAMDSFRIKDIRVEGLQRISLGTVYNYLPLKRGDTLDEDGADAAIHALYKTGFFRDVTLEREGDVLVIFLAERPAIASIKFEGNDAIPTDQLTSNVKLVGLSEGHVFDYSMLDKVKQELKQAYLAMGKYNAQVRSTVTPLERNRVAVLIEIAEGDVAAIRHLNIVGNKVFSQAELTKKFQLGPDAGWFSSSDQYSKQKLAADLETLRSYYMNNGYINFDILSTQVTITPDKQDVYITINISEGDKYNIGKVAVTGNTIVPKSEIEKLISVHPGDTFSRLEITESHKRISDALGNIGYAFANINPIPELDKKKHEVNLTYMIDPGQRVSVRRINLTGNLRTDDEVLRREMRQMEGGWMSTSKVQRSVTRLNRLGYFNDVSVKTPAVPGNPDQVDVNFDVAERDSFGSFNFGIGYGDVQGMLINTSINWDNFMGTGEKMSINFDNSTTATTYSFNSTNPYWTNDGVSRYYSLYYRTTDSGAANTADYTRDTYGASLRFGVPVSEYDTMSYGLRYEHSKMNVSSATSAEVLDFCFDASTTSDIYDCQYDTYSFELGWSHDTRDRAIFPDAGGKLSLSSELGLPATDNAHRFYKLRLNKQHYFPLAKHLTFSMKGELAYADVYGTSKILAPYERYYAGGVQTVRGYRTNTMFSTPGTLDSRGDPLGGNARLLGTMEMVFPPPWELDTQSMRLKAFVDAGNVYNTSESTDLSELRYTTGLTLAWMTPVGPLSFSYAIPLNEKTGDRTEQFQFTLGIQ